MRLRDRVAFIGCVLGLVGFVGAGCGGQGNPQGPDAATDAVVTADASPDAAQPFEISVERVYADLAYLADPALAGRAPGTPGNEAAVTYVEALFEELGLWPAGDEGTYRQRFEYDAWAPSDLPLLSLDGTALQLDEDFLLLFYSGSADVTEEVMFVGYGMTVPPYSRDAYPLCPLPEAGYDDYAEVDVTGRVVLVLRHGPNDAEAIYEHCPGNEACVDPPCLWNFGYKAANAHLHGASAMLLAQDYRHPGDELIPGNIGPEYFREDLAGVFVCRQRLEEAIPELPAWAAALDASLTPQSRATGVMVDVNISAGVEAIWAENVLGALMGEDAEVGSEVLVMGAHLDHLGTDPFSGAIYHGADDNASGTAVIMELARALASSPTPPARTVLFAAWNAEEAGLVGSYFYTQHPSFPMENTILSFSVDMVGVGDGEGILVFGGAGYRSLMLLMLRAVEEAGTGWTISPAPASPASDHAVFVAAGVPGVLISSSGEHLHYHTPADSIETIQRSSLEATLGVIWPTLEIYAQGSEALYQP